MSGGDWRSRAVPVGGGDWRSRAVPVGAPVAQPVDPPTAQPAPQEPGALDATSGFGTALRHFGKGASLGFIDELAGLQGMGDEVSGRLFGSDALAQYRDRPLMQALAARYRRERDDSRRELAAGEDAHPIIAGAADIAGGLAVPMPGGGAKTGAGLLQRALQLAGKGAVYGAAAGAGGSDADLTRGELGRFAGDVAGSTLAGGALGGAGGLLAGKGGQVVARAEEDARAAAQKAADKAFNSARSSLGGETSTAARTLEQIERALSDPGVDPAVKAKALAFRQSPEGVALVNQVIESSVERGGGQMGRLAAAKQALADAAAGKAPSAIEASTAARTSLPQAARAVGSRFVHMAQKVVPPVVGGIVGERLFGSPLLGAGVGAVTSAVMGAPGRTLANMVRDPSVRTAAGRAAEKIGGVLSHLGPRVAEEEIDRARLDAWLKALRGQ